MPFKVERLITMFVILLFALRVLGASAVTPSPENATVAIHFKKSNSDSILAAFLLEKTEESEKTGLKKQGIGPVVLVDFSEVAFSLSYYYSGQIQMSAPTSRYDVHPPVHKLNRVFLI